MNEKKISRIRNVSNIRMKNLHKKDRHDYNNCSKFCSKAIKQFLLLCELATGPHVTTLLNSTQYFEIDTSSDECVISTNFSNEKQPAL